MDELVRVIEKGLQDLSVNVFKRVKTSNGMVDCVVVLPNGIITIDFIDLRGKLEGSDNLDWSITDEMGKKSSLDSNLIKQIDCKRSDIKNKLKEIKSGGNLDRISERDIIRVGGWGYFRSGTEFDGMDSLLPATKKWFKVVTSDNLIENLRRVNSGYTMFDEDVIHIANGMGLHRARENQRLTEQAVAVDGSDDSELVNKEIIRRPAVDVVMSSPETEGGPEGVAPNLRVVAPHHKAVNPFSSEPGDDVQVSPPALMKELPETRIAEPSPPEGKNDDGEEIIDMLQNLASHGHAPLGQCGLFAIGNDEKIARLRKTYLEGKVKRGGSAEKFAIGDAGSGKSHFISQLIEEARGLGYITASVKLEANAEIISNAFLLRMIANEIALPGESRHGLPFVMDGMLEMKRREAITKGMADDEAKRAVMGWIDSLHKGDYVDLSSVTAISRTLRARFEGDQETFEKGCRWLSGDFDDKYLAEAIGAQPVGRKHMNYAAKQNLLTLYQVIKSSGYIGTLIAMDETDHGWMNITDEHKRTFYSLLQSDINSLMDRKNLGVFVIYSLMPVIADHIRKYPALQSRIEPAIPDQSFENGYTTCPSIIITRPGSMSGEDIVQELSAIGRKLADLLYSLDGPHLDVPKEKVYGQIRLIAERTYKEDPTTSNRRKLVKSVGALLVELYDSGSLPGVDGAPKVANGPTRMES